MPTFALVLVLWPLSGLAVCLLVTALKALIIHATQRGF